MGSFLWYNDTTGATDATHYRGVLVVLVTSGISRSINQQLKYKNKRGLVRIHAKTNHLT